jgi:2-amino-4-hydroxy-6-hydroxymethyldihydropteridine diphosphokinase
MISRRIAHQACLLLGSNIDPQRNIPRAMALLGEVVEITSTSLVWETPAVGSAGENFWNVAVLVRTHLDARQLKDAVLRPLEKRLGRQRRADKFAPRTIDIDIVAWDCQVTDPNIWQYAYAAVPVSEVLPCDTRSAAGEPLALAALRLAQHTSIQARLELI